VNKTTLADQHKPNHFAFEFKGQAGDFFGIWFVNSFLTLLTFGLYSPWAKVRTQQYFYGNTNLAGGSFQFLANPLSLFKTRLIALGLFILFIISQNFTGAYLTATVIYIAMIAIYLAIAPLLLVMLMSFRLRYSAWRGIAFKFNKDFAGAYRVYLAPAAMFALVMVSLVVPFYITDESAQDTDTEIQSMNDSGMMQYSSDSDSILNVDNTGDVQASDERIAMDENQPGGFIEDTTSMEEGASMEEGSSNDDAEYDEVIDSEPDSSFANVEPIHFIPALIIALIFAALLPYFDFINNRFLARNAQFGTSKVKFLASARDYYIVYGVWLAATVIVALLWVGVIYIAGATSEDGNGAGGPVSGAMMSTMILITFMYVLLSKAYIKSRRYNLLAGNLEIGNGHRMRAKTTFLGYLWLMISNSIGYSMSFGLLKAWVMVRTARYFLKHTSLQANGSLDEFTAAERESVNSLAEETTDVFDLDLA
jgi:uncharacterized membrane protein YjgN (DUF898 family)